MALTDMGEQVNRMVDANRGNPGALQQKHALNKDLLSLLALQKLQSEKKAAENELAMSMKGTPGTILEQREKELTGRATKEVTEGVAGALKTKQQQEQNNLQRMTSANPQMAGIAGQPAPNMARMAGGGIVAFAGKDGSEVKGKTAKEILKEAGISPERFAEMSDAEQKQVLNTLNLPTGIRRAISAPRRAIEAGDELVAGPLAALYDVFAMPQQALGHIIGGVGRATGLRDPSSKDPFTFDTWTPAYDALRRKRMRQGGAKSPYIAMDQLRDSTTDAGIAEAGEQAANSSGLAALQPRPTSQPSVSGPRPVSQPPAAPILQPPAGPQGFAGQYKQGIANANTELGRSNMADMYKELLAKRQAVNAKVANQQGNFFDRFAGAKSLTGAAVNKVNNRNRRNRDELDRNADELNIIESGMTADTAAAKAALTAGGQYATGTTKETSDKLSRDIQVERNRIAELAARATGSAAQAKVLTLASNNVANAYAKWQDQKRKALADDISLNTLKGEEYKARRNAILAPIIADEKRAMAPLEEQLKNLFTANRASGLTTVNRPRS